MRIRPVLTALATLFSMPLLAACPQARPPAPPAAPVDLASPGMTAARKSFECAAPVDVSALHAAAKKNGKQWYETPPGFTVFGFPATDLGVTPPPTADSETFASVRASPDAVLAAVRSAIPDARASSPGHPDNPALTGANYYYITWGAAASGDRANRMTLEGEGPETYVICHMPW